MTTSARILFALSGQKESERQLAFNFVPQGVVRPYVATCDENDVRVTAIVEDLDRLGLLVKTVRLESIDSATTNDAERLKDQVERVSSELAACGESFLVIEYDEMGCTAVLRTVPDSRTPNRFFELLFKHGNEIELSHYTVDPDRRRVRSDANMSRDTFSALVDGMYRLLS